MKNIVIAVILLLNLVTYGQKPISNTLPRPKLVVGLVIDQMRWDYLYRYYDRYGSGGFKRMLNEGFTCENTYIDYIPTVTAIGHSTIYTGSVPAIHGIAGNDFIINATGKVMYCTEDTSVQTVGSTSAAGKMSPKNLTASTITDELKLATNFKSKVISVALKDRGSILPAGHAADAAYWFDDATGNFITSTFYVKELPAWVQKFNEQKLPEKYLKQDWNTFYHIKTYTQSFPDNNPYEGKFAGQATPTFPVKTSEMFAKSYSIIRTTPYGNTFTFDMAKAAVDNEQLGKGTVTDFLAVSCSSPDAVGHQFGPNSVEVEDIYLRLDKDIASFFTYLDSKVGKGNYTVFLSADHGAANNPQLLIDKKIPAGYWSGATALRDLNLALEEAFNVKGLVTSFSNSQVHFNQQLLQNNKLNEDALNAFCVKVLRDKPGVAFVADVRNLGEAAMPDLLKERIIKGYNKDRSGRVVYVLQPGYYSAAPAATGTTHGTWNPYDAHIPLVFMGWGIKHGSTRRAVNMSDIAPTLAALLHIQEPSGNIGKAITEVLKD